MSEPEIPDLLDRAAGRVEVGAPPIHAMLRDASRARRNRLLGAVGAVAAVVLVAGGTAYLVGAGDPGRPGPVVAPDGPTVEPDEARVPEGYRLVAIGRAAIAVPPQWGDNDIHCGTPLSDTVVIDQYFTRACARQRPRGVESVQVGGPERADVSAEVRSVEIDGHAGELEETTCFDFDTLSIRRADPEEVLCSATLRIPDLGASFTASSSSRPEATARSKVEEMLSHVLVLDDRVGVPGWQEIASRAQEWSGKRYAAKLAELGLRAELVPETYPGIEPGHLLGIDPAPGTVVEPGSTVRVRVVAEPQGPADEVSVGMNSDAEDWDPDSFGSLQVRANPTVRIKVGDGIWAYADGRRASTLAGRLDGDSLEVDGWEEGPNFPHSWRAVRPGRTTVTLTITADGEEVVLGRVQVVVTP